MSEPNIKTSFSCLFLPVSEFNQGFDDLLLSTGCNQTSLPSIFREEAETKKLMKKEIIRFR
jgi:hypothetical protein